MCIRDSYTGPRTGKRDRPKPKDGKIDMKNLDLTRMEKMEMKDCLLYTSGQSGPKSKPNGDGDGRDG